ncbi:NUDIX hydrolase [Pseudomaricurvus alkylphenolicus]|jgi:ADP-ribose pyrophosphatase YjhB (NUDIX family)|uniref:NUDIX hydrolase n=1 Tax=Pseudomaricurvus alkylphenolicus TaxID=1306991 RepID=UPI0014215CF2|nr:NUDIX hydrolase [Pseudomaricurvus alkylphenolicus]NIB43013.1 NUDIX hydrolase [Pseudomaricurvus alkylphenolicus]
MKYCSNCGAGVRLQIPAGDDRQRHVCNECDTIHYQNPHIIAGCLPIYEDRVLLCKRAIEPRHGYWTLPAGFMENGETTEEGALRESWEEARAVMTLDGLYTLFSLPEINQVYMFFKGTLDNLEFGPGPESLEVELFTEQQIPWDELAFPVVKKTLRHYFADRPNDHYPLRSEALYRPKPKV